MVEIISGYCENSLVDIESESIDLIYIDPPYEMNYTTNIPGDKRWNTSGETDGTFDVYMERAFSCIEG
jgi:DNA modification methylase